MATNNRLALGLLEATHLTRAGRVLEATAAIQRVLRPQPISESVVNERASDRGGTATGRVIEGVFSRVTEPSQRHETNDVIEGRAGKFVAGSYTNQHGTRPYRLYVPTGYVGQALPMLVMLHGCTQTPDDFAVGTRMNVLAEERQWFVLYPAQTRSANRSRCWNWFKHAHQRRDQGEPAIIAGMTREVLKRYCIDARKVYVAGLSAGGAMAAVMGTAYPDLYAAIGIHSGLPVGSAHDLPSAFAAMRGAPPAPPAGAAAGSAPRTLPAIVFHGDCDATVHPRNGERVVSQCVDGNESVDIMVQQGQVPGGHAYTRRVHRDGAGRVVLEHWEVHGAGHAWFGGNTRGSYTDPKGPDAGREMMRFFCESAPPDPG
jgi:poly(hydroxyalkanoate) depolymerase family esterase